MRICSSLLLGYTRNPNRSRFIATYFEHRRRLIPADLGARRDKLTVLSTLRSSRPRTMLSSALSSSVAEDASVANRLWSKARKVAALAAYSPFIVSLAAGTLDKESFRSNIAQDIYFLKAFANAFDVVKEHADDDDDKDTICRMRDGVLEDIAMHDSIIRGWGIDSIEDIPASSSTTKYTDFLLATASGKIEGEKGAGKIVTPFEKTKLAAYTIGSVISFVSLYSFLGKELRSFLPDDGSAHSYKKWIDNYSSDAFKASVIQFQELLDKLSVTLTGEELEIIDKLYIQSTKLEVNFFSSQTVLQPVVVPFVGLHDPANRLVIFSDFDLTCTVHDSSATLAELAIQTLAKAEQSEAENLDISISSSELRKSLNALSTRYAEEYEKSVENVLQSEEAKTFDYEGLCKGLEQLSEFEKRANSRVIESGVLRGMNLEAIKRAGEGLLLHDGCSGFFQKIVEKKQALNIELHLLSYCWCADLIRFTFQSVGTLSSMSIHSNELEFEGSVSTGQIIRKMETPANKREKFRTILSTHSKQLSVYIGDSVGDLLCLLEADVGIVIGSSAKLRRVGKHFGVSFVPLFSGLVDKQRQLAGGAPSVWKGLSGVLYTVSSWSEIQAFILGEI